jgi:hypothetical protein
MTNVSALYRSGCGLVKGFSGGFRADLFVLPGPEALQPILRLNGKGKSDRRPAMDETFSMKAFCFLQEDLPPEREAA